MSDETKTYYRPVPGSRELVTGPRRSDEILAAIESEPDSAPPSPLRQYRGEWLGRVSASTGIVIPAAVFDLLAPTQAPMEQAVYFHLFRLSHGQGRNFCRVGKREIASRSGLSDRRLNVALDGLVRKGHLRPLHRNTLGTLYRVYLPGEVRPMDTEPETPATQAATIKSDTPSQAPVAPAPSKTSAPPKKKKPVQRTRPLESPLNEDRFADVTGQKPKGPGLSEMVARFFDARKIKAGAMERQLAVTALTELLEDGFSRQEVSQALDWFIENQPDEKSLDRLPYFMSSVVDK